jgi:hypothetical protein
MAPESSRLRAFVPWDFRFEATAFVVQRVASVAEIASA